MKSRAERIADKRQKQPISELARKWIKAKGRHSNAFWAQEAIDLAFAEGSELHKKLFALQS